MKWLAVDARTDAWNEQLLGASWSNGDEAHFGGHWPQIRETLVFAADLGYTFVAHGAETVCMTLFMARQEHFMAHYRNERWSYGEWFYDRNKPPVQIWDSFRLSGGLSVRELAESQGVESYPAPSVLRRPRIDPDGTPCWDHKRLNCRECFGARDKWSWICEKHERGECMECWQTQTVRIIHRYMTTYADLLGKFDVPPKRSLSSASMALWRKIDRPKPIRLRDKRAANLARLGYHGGRVEPYKLGRIGPAYYADVHMMYPAVMSTVRMPDPRATEYNDSEYLDEGVIQYEGVTDATVTIPACHVGPLPIRSSEALQFPIGHVRQVFTNVELRAAIARGCTIEAIHRTAYSHGTVEAFTGFCQGFISWRDDMRGKRDPMELTVKQLLNQLSGRIGLSGEQVQMYVMPLPPGTTDADWPDHEIQVKRDVILMRKQITRYPTDQWANPLWAATITGYARVRLMELMEQQGHALAYVDTDSIISTEPIQGLGEGVGQLEDGGFYGDCMIVAPKMYAMTTGSKEDKYRASGVPKRLAERYLKMAEASWSEPVRLLEAWNTPSYPGELRIVHAERVLGVTKRHLLNPQAVYRDGGYSDTMPITHDYIEQAEYRSDGWCDE